VKSEKSDVKNVTVKCQRSTSPCERHNSKVSTMPEDTERRCGDDVGC